MRKLQCKHWMQTPPKKNQQQFVLPKYRGTDVDKVFKGLREIAEKSD